MADKIVTRFVSYGCLEVEYKTKLVTVSYAGGMVSTEESARECFEALYGPGSWITLKSLSTKWEGDFSYMWVCEVPASEFEKL
jgi:hypothetical protein